MARINQDEFEYVMIHASILEKESLLVDAIADCDRIIFQNANGAWFSLPKEAFQVSGQGLAPDFGDLSVIDHGLTLKLGGYESSAQAMFADCRIKMFTNSRWRNNMNINWWRAAVFAMGWWGGAFTSSWIFNQPWTAGMVAFNVIGSLISAIVLAKIFN